MYKELRGEMVKADLSVAELAKKIGVTEKTLRNKLNGITDFTFPEAKLIRSFVNPEKSLEDLFFREDSKELCRK